MRFLTPKELFVAFLLRKFSEIPILRFGSPTTLFPKNQFLSNLYATISNSIWVLGKNLEKFQIYIKMKNFYLIFEEILDFLHKCCSYLEKYFFQNFRCAFVAEKIPLVRFGDLWKSLSYLLAKNSQATFWYSLIGVYWRPKAAEIFFLWWLEPMKNNHDIYIILLNFSKNFVKIAKLRPNCPDYDKGGCFYSIEF